MAITNYAFYTWISGYQYSKWDVVYGATAADTRYFYSTKDTNTGHSPLAQFIYTPTQTARNGNVCRTTFTQTGVIHFQPGSVVVVANVQPDNLANYTGVVLTAGAGYVEYLSPGRDGINGVTAGSVTSPLHPYWTTGFYWLPSWSTDVSHDPTVVRADMGDGYSQRQNPFINSNSLVWGLVFDERTDKEAMSLMNFCENQGGVTPFCIPFPVGNLYNRNDLKYVNGAAKHRLNSYGLNSVTVSVTQVFDV